MKIITISTLITIIATANMVFTSIIQQANAEPKVQKQTEQTKTAYDPKNGETTYTDKYNVTTNKPKNVWVLFSYSEFVRFALPVSDHLVRLCNI